VASPVLHKGKDPLPQLAGNTLPNAVQDTFDLLCSKENLAGTCSTWCLPRNPEVFLQICFSSVWFLTYIGAWGFSNPCAGLGTSS